MERRTTVQQRQCINYSQTQWLACISQTSSCRVKKQGPHSGPSLMQVVFYRDPWAAGKAVKKSRGDQGKGLELESRVVFWWDLCTCLRPASSDCVLVWWNRPGIWEASLLRASFPSWELHFQSLSTSKGPASCTITLHIRVSAYELEDVGT